MLTAQTCPESYAVPAGFCNGQRILTSGRKFQKHRCQARQLRAEAVTPQARQACSLDSTSSSSGSSLGKKAEGVGLGGLLLLSENLPARAEELDLSKSAPSGTTIGEIVLLSAPLLLYGLFNVYRSKINPKASISDFLFFTAALVIVGNVFSIVVLKVRLY